MSEDVYGGDRFVTTSNGMMVTLLELWAHVGLRLGDPCSVEFAMQCRDKIETGGLGTRSIRLEDLSTDELVGFDTIVREVVRMLMDLDEHPDLAHAGLHLSRVEWLVWMREILRMIAEVSPVPRPPLPEVPERDRAELALEELRHQIYLARTKDRYGARHLELLRQSIAHAHAIGSPYAQKQRHDLIDLLRKLKRWDEVEPLCIEAAQYEQDPEMKAILLELAATKE